MFAGVTPALITTGARPNPSGPALVHAAVIEPADRPHTATDLTGLPGLAGLPSAVVEMSAARQWAADRPTRTHLGPPAPSAPSAPAAAVAPTSAAPAAAPPPAAGQITHPPRKKPATPRPPRSRAPQPPVAVAAADGSAAAAVVRYALAQVGKPYRFATAGPNTFDCSGLAKAAYAQVGINIPHQTGGIIGRGRAVGRSQLEAGDLVFPSSGHVGIYVGDGKFVHAPKAGDHVRVAPIYAFWAARRLL